MESLEYIHIRPTGTCFYPKWDTSEAHKQNSKNMEKKLKMPWEKLEICKFYWKLQFQRFWLEME